MVDLKNPSKNKFFISLFIALFLYNCVKFINMPESDLPIISTLFAMIFFLSLIILLLHKKDLIEKHFKYKQEKLDKYLTKEH